MNEAIASLRGASRRRWPRPWLWPAAPTCRASSRSRAARCAVGRPGRSRLPTALHSGRAMVARLRRRAARTPRSTRRCRATPASGSRRRGWRAPRPRPRWRDAAAAAGRRLARPHAPALHRQRPVPPPLAGAIHEQRHPAADRQLGARLLRQEPGGAGCGPRRGPARRRPMPKPRACCWPATWRAAYFQLARLQRPARRGAAHAGAARGSAAAGAGPRARRPGHQLELRQSEGALPEARQQIEALQEQAALGAACARGARRPGQSRRGR